MGNVVGENWKKNESNLKISERVAFSLLLGFCLFFVCPLSQNLVQGTTSTPVFMRPCTYLSLRRTKRTLFTLR